MLQVWNNTSAGGGGGGVCVCVCVWGGGGGGVCLKRKSQRAYIVDFKYLK